MNQELKKLNEVLETEKSLLDAEHQQAKRDVLRLKKEKDASRKDLNEQISDQELKIKNLKKEVQLCEESKLESRKELGEKEHQLKLVKMAGEENISELKLLAEKYDKS